MKRGPLRENKESGPKLQHPLILILSLSPVVLNIQICIRRTPSRTIHATVMSCYLMYHASDLACGFRKIESERKRERARGGPVKDSKYFVGDDDRQRTPARQGDLQTSFFSWQFEGTSNC